MSDDRHGHLRIASYNILDGGLGRLDPIAETLKVIDADVTALIEASRPEHVRYLSEKLGLYWTLAESPTSRFHVAVLSKSPIERMLNVGVRHGALSRAAMEVVVRVNGEPWRVVAAHLASGLGEAYERQRLAELDRVLAFIEAGEAGPTVIAGDLNTNAPYHPVDVAAAAPAVRARMEADPAALGYDVVGRLLAAGWVDAHHHCPPPEPEHTYATGHLSTRLDYIFADALAAARIVAAGVERRGFAPYCSDHFPVWADLRVEPAG